MNQEYGCNYSDVFATCIPYWDERCGSVFYEEEELQKTFDSFIEKIETFKPREYILENLSMEVCEKQLIGAIQNLPINHHSFQPTDPSVKKNQNINPHDNIIFKFYKKRSNKQGLIM